MEKNYHYSTFGQYKKSHQFNSKKKLNQRNLISVPKNIKRNNTKGSKEY
jgi:hypothetical protein